jgi:hypothetical protein
MTRADNGTDDPNYQRVLNLLKTMDKPITFYGKVIDQNGNPVVNATVETHITDSSGVGDVMVTTGAGGEFEVSGKSGRKLFIDKIICIGYEYTRKFAGKSSFENGTYTPDKSKPFIFMVRKKEPATLVLKGDMAWKIKPAIAYYEVDLVNQKYGKQGRFKADGSLAKIDLKINAVLTPEKTSYLVTLDGKSTNSELLMDDTFLYVAPETGYEKTLTLEIPIGSTITRYFYVKGRNGGIYSRIEAKFEVKPDGVIAALNIFTNPKGERNLDFDEELWGQYIQQRFDDQRQRNIDRELRMQELYKKP